MLAGTRDLYMESKTILRQFMFFEARKKFIKSFLKPRIKKSEVFVIQKCS